MVNPLVYLVNLLLSMVNFIVVASVIMHFLVVFKVINLHNPMIYKLHDLLFRLTEPLFSRVRRYVPPLNGVDLSPLVVLVGIQFLQYTLAYVFA